MIHTKLLIRRLAYVPWLLTFGLVLGWAGEAQADITLTLDKKSIREEAGAVTIKVTAKTDAKILAATDVLLDWADEAASEPVQVPGYGAGTKTEFGPRIGVIADPIAVFDRYRISLPSLSFPKDAAIDATVSGDIIFTPHEDKIIGNDNLDAEATANGDADNIRIYIVGSTTGAVDETVTGASFVLIDNDQMSTEITLSYGKAKIAQDADPTNVTVTATLSGATLKENLRFTLLLDEDSEEQGEATRVATRDEDYRADGLPITILKGSPTGKVDIKITPLNLEGGSIQLTAKDLVVVDNDENTAQVYGIVEHTATAADGNPDTGVDPPVIVNQAIEMTLMVDFNRNGEYDDTVDNVKIGAKFNRRIPLTVTSDTNVILIDPNKEAAAEGVKLSPATVREDAGEMVIDLDVTLKNELSEPARVSFTIEAPEDGAKRDVDYKASFSDLTIPAGSKKGKATLALLVIDNDGQNLPKDFTVVATVKGADPATGVLTIADNETPTDEIMLEVDKDEVMAGTTEEITVTGTINGKRFDDDVKVVLVLAAKGEKPNGIEATARRDIDFDAVLRSLTISSGDISGSTSISITALKGGDVKVVLTQLESPLKNEDDEPVNAVAVGITLKDAPGGAEAAEPGALAFEDSEVDLGSTVFGYVVGKEIDPLELPGAMGGTDDDKSYSVSGLPAGLSFDAATQTISGTPTAATEVDTVTYVVLDTDKKAVALIISIEVKAAPAPTTSVDKVTATQTSIRENGETTVISITATLAAPAPVAETIRFTIGNSTGGGKAAVRDVDYTSGGLGSVKIEAGETQASSTMTLTPLNNNETDGNREFGVHATGSGGAKSVDITIADDETASTSISLSASPYSLSEGRGCERGYGHRDLGRQGAGRGRVRPSRY